jgi:hypothetical protein
MMVNNDGAWETRMKIEIQESSQGAGTMDGDKERGARTVEWGNRIGKSEMQIQGEGSGLVVGSVCEWARDGPGGALE